MSMSSTHQKDRLGNGCFFATMVWKVLVTSLERYLFTEWYT